MEEKETSVPKFIAAPLPQPLPVRDSGASLLPKVVPPDDRPEHPKFKAAENPLDVRQQPLTPQNREAFSRAPMPVLCAQCGTRTKLKPGSLPFSTGASKGGFLCMDCWVVHFDDNPELLADAATRQWVATDARRVRLKRAGEGSELVYDDGKNRAFLTTRKTILVDLQRLPFGGQDEFNLERFESIAKIFEKIRDTVPGYGKE